MFRQISRVFIVAWLLWFVPAVTAADAPTKVYVVLWFDTEDYILPASDDAAMRVAEFLTGEGIRGTFKVVGEKARTLQRRGRTDVIAALKKHEIGYHSNFHSTQPTPALYCGQLGWDEGVAEFDRREKPGYDDVKRVFGTAPTCYGQPGSSWSPQSYGAMKNWGMEIYLDAGRHVDLGGKPCYYCGVLNLYKLTYTMRASLENPAGLRDAETQFLAAREKLLAEGGGIVSIIYHPCEFVHKQFWDGVNFSKGTNPPREKWRLPPTKTPEESRQAYEIFANYVRMMKRLPDVEFVTATDLARLYADRAKGRSFTPAELKALVGMVSEDVTFVRRDDYTLSASDVFALLNTFVADRFEGKERGTTPLSGTPYGPTNRVPVLSKPVTTDGSQFGRTAVDVAEYLKKQGRIPSVVWLGSVPVPPEAYLQGLAKVVIELADRKPMPDVIEIMPAKLAAGRHVADDAANLWGWVIFPPDFRAPAMMELARRQAWTLKPALLARGTK